MLVVSIWNIMSILSIFYIKEVYSKSSSIDKYYVSPSDVSSPETSFPILSATEIPKIVSISTSTPKSKMLTVGVSTIDNLFIKFVYGLMPVFEITSNGLQKIIDVMKTMTQMQQLYEIPTIISYFTPMYINLENALNKQLLNVSNLPPQKAPYMLVPPNIITPYFRALKLLINSTENTINLLNQLQDQVNKQLNHLKIGPKKHTIIMTISKANRFETIIENLGTENENIQKAFQTMAQVHEEGLIRNQNNTDAKQLLSLDINWYNNMAAVFMQIYPKINAFAEAIINDGATNTKIGTFTVSINALNLSIREITKELIHLIKILGDYFQIYDYGLLSLKKELKGE